MRGDREIELERESKFESRMAKLLAIIMISILVEVECTTNEISFADESTCSDISAKFDVIQNTLDDLKEQISRKGLTPFANIFPFSYNEILASFCITKFSTVRLRCIHNLYS